LQIVPQRHQVPIQFAHILSLEYYILYFPKLIETILARRDQQALKIHIQKLAQMLFDGKPGEIPIPLLGDIEFAKTYCILLKAGLLKWPTELRIISGVTIQIANQFVGPLIKLPTVFPSLFIGLIREYNKDKKDMGELTKLLETVVIFDALFLVPHENHRLEILKVLPSLLLDTYKRAVEFHHVEFTYDVATMLKDIIIGPREGCFFAFFPNQGNCLKGFTTIHTRKNTKRAYIYRF
jgi:hypothetical protein